MADENLGKLIQYIVDQLQELEAPISTIRIVKLLYLMDVAYFRRRRKLLTGLEWIGYKYGPYAFQIPQAIQALGYRLEREEVLTTEGRPAFVFRAEEEVDLSEMVDFATQGLIQDAIKKWAYEKLNDLLNYVYFCTTPMEEARFGQRLDFEVIPRPSRLADIRPRLSEDQLGRYRSDLAAMREQLQHRLEETQAMLQSRPLRIDAAYREAMEKRDDEEKSDLPSGLRLSADDAALS